MFLDWDVLNVAIQALGWALIHFVWQGALIGALIAVGMVALKGARPGIRYALGLAGMALLAVTPIITFMLHFELPGASVDAGTAVALMPAMQVAAQGAQQPLELTLSQSLEGALPWIVAAWGIGVLGHSLRVLLNWRRMRRLTRVGVREPSRELLARVEMLSEILGIKRAVRVLESTLIEVPTVLGWLKPVILLPTSSLVGLTPRQLELVIAHELGHVRRWDYIINLLQVFVETALFYHPVVGWVSRRVREEREKCCDDLVVDHCGSRLEYAKALTNLESIRQGDLSPALAATDGQLVQRIERIVCNHSAEPREAVAGNTLLFVVVGLVVLAAGNLGDPLKALDARRSTLADTLVNELLISTVPAYSEAVLAPLESARAVFSGEDTQLAATTQPVQTQAQPDPAPVAIELASAPASAADADRTAKVQADESSTRAVVATPVASPSEERATYQPLPIEPAVMPVETPALSAAASAGIEQSEPVPMQQASADVAEKATVARNQPTAVRQVAPEYPVRARLAGQQGFVEISFEVSSSGRPVEIQVVDSRPRRVFDKAAVYALRQWRFDPASTVGLGVDRFNQRFDFSLSATGGQTGTGAGECVPLTGTRICRSESPTSLRSIEASP